VRVSDFDFSLPEDLIALRPASPRDSARLLVVREGGSGFEEATVRDLPRYLGAGDVCVFNDTRVIPAQLSAVRPARGAAEAAKIDVTLHKRLSDSSWAAFAKPGRKLAVGDMLSFGAFEARVEAKSDGGEITLAFDRAGAALDQAIAAHGVMPLPPYIAGRRATDERDESDYQTIFAARDGAVAAPTAGLHFTPELLTAMEARGVKRAGVTLHVGAGTFLPVKADDTDAHVMHAEWGEVSAATAAAVNDAHAARRRVAAIGTTSLRILESAATEGVVRPFAGDTQIFITPGYRFRAVDVLLTNFHLPRSTLFMLVSAFCGLETMRAAYAHAIERRFRFYSYGDACLLIRKGA
jgi:S-adenosylmethionine:tRNA ribosyltransferase-isomerase